MTADIETEAQGTTLVRVPAGDAPDLVQHLTPLQVDEPARILRARGAWGILNLVPATVQNQDIFTARDKRIRLLHALSNDTCTVSDLGRRRAEALVIAAAESLNTPAKPPPQCHLSITRHQRISDHRVIWMASLIGY